MKNFKKYIKESKTQEKEMKKPKFISSIDVIKQSKEFMKKYKEALEALKNA